MKRSSDKELHWDSICERQRDTFDIRKRLADAIRVRRKTDVYNGVECLTLEIEIMTLSWVLGRERSPLWSHGW